MLHVDIKNSLKDAMRAKDEVGLRTIRGVLSACTNELVAKKRKPDEIPSDEDVLTVIRRLVKQRKDSIEQFTAGGRTDLARDEEAELKILEAYLPQMMSREEIKKAAEAKKADMGELDKSKLGMFVGALMRDLKGKADGADVKAVVDEMFS